MSYFTPRARPGEARAALRGGLPRFGAFFPLAAVPRAPPLPLLRFAGAFARRAAAA